MSILAAVLRKRQAQAEADQRGIHSAEIAARTQALERSVIASINVYWQQFVDRLDFVIESAKGEPGAIGPMPKHQWNADKSRVRFQQPKPDGSIGWGRYSADLKGEIRAAVITGGGGGLGAGRIIDLIKQHTDEPETAADIVTEYVSDDDAKVSRKVIDGIEQRYTYVNDRPVYRATAPDGTDLTASAWNVVKVSFDAKGRPSRRQQLDGVPADDPASLAWPA